LDRLSGLVDREVISGEEADDLRDSFNVIMLIRIRHQVNQIHQGREPDNYINPDEMNIVQRTMLKESFKAIDRLQKLLQTRYDITS
ncbi:MAG: putative nucleotidyltransferase substrate binding domain-containing protein, partial [Thermodesulfobacteriota bacterium]